MTNKEEGFTDNRIIPFNPKYYDLEKALAKYPYIEWVQHCKIEPGSTVYVYIGKTGGQQLHYEFEVLDTNITILTIDDSDCALEPTKLESHTVFMRLKLIRRIPKGLITLQDMLDHGLSKYPQSQVRVPVALQKYIDSVL